MMRRVLSMLFMVCFLFLAAGASAKHAHTERYYQEKWCAENNGKTEVVMPDSSRCDCLTGKNAIEFDFGKKWAEAIGQALFYGLKTGKRPGVVLILNGQKDRKYWIRMTSTIQHYHLPIDVWEMDATSENQQITK